MYFTHIHVLFASACRSSKSLPLMECTSLLVASHPIQWSVGHSIYKWKALEWSLLLEGVKITPLFLLCIFMGDVYVIWDIEKQICADLRWHAPLYFQGQQTWNPSKTAYCHQTDLACFCLMTMNIHWCLKTVYGCSLVPRPFSASSEYLQKLEVNKAWERG